MICVTGSEPDVAGLRARQTRLAAADLHELRLDLLTEPPPELTEVAVVDPARIVVTFRPRRQGGAYAGDERARIETLREAAAAGFGFVDLEDDVAESDAARVLDAAARSRCRVIRSTHVFETGGDARAAMARLRSLRGHVLKLAVAVADAAELGALAELGASRDRPVVLVGMGAAGLLSRVSYRRFGSAWTYVAAEEGRETAPGQLGWERARAWRLAADLDPAPVALLGGGQVFGSPGPLVHNRLFAEERAPLVYVPVQTGDPAGALALLRRIGFAGASVTMPLKERVAALLDEVDESAQAVGAVNTLRVRDHRVYGTNTDGEGALRALEAHGPVRGARVLLLGAGGTARAIGHALFRAGAGVALWNRTQRRAEQAARDLGLCVAAEPDPAGFDILVNATSVGLGSDETPVADVSTLSGKLVLDCVGQPAETRLVREARAAGATVVTGQEMWLEQAADQASLWLGRPVAAARLRSLL